MTERHCNSRRPAVFDLPKLVRTSLAQFLLDFGAIAFYYLLLH